MGKERKTCSLPSLQTMQFPCQLSKILTESVYIFVIDIYIYTLSTSEEFNICTLNFPGLQGLARLPLILYLQEVVKLCFQQVPFSVPT